MTVGIICEYNPLHLGHLAQIRRIREELGAETAIVCAMSGNFVQRGAPAIVSKDLRAKAAVLSGADLVLELPVTVALSSAEGFAAGGVALLAPLCDKLCFGAETADKAALEDTARALLSPRFPPLLRRALETGASFPAARQTALGEMGLSGELLSSPNNILAVEYTKAILAQNAPMDIFPIFRPGSYHARTADLLAPSATSVRARMLGGESWEPFVPDPVRPVLAGAALHCTAAGERAVLAKLRTMTDDAFEALPYGSEGLWRKFMHASRREPTLESVLTAVKSKRYTRSRIDRMAMCAFLGLTAEDLSRQAPYTRVLGFSQRGREILRAAKQKGLYLNAGERFDHPYWDLEARCTDLYALFTSGAPDPPGMEARYRVFYQKESPPPWGGADFEKSS